jgi:hypothetical protein
VRSPVLLSLATFALACTSEPNAPAESATTGTTTGCFGCACDPELPCGAGLECTANVCSIIDETGGDQSPPSTCGWNPGASWYDCGFEGADPDGDFPRACPMGLTADVACPTSLPFEGCCDAEGSVWYCEEGLVVMTNC